MLDKYAEYKEVIMRGEAVRLPRKEMVATLFQAFIADAEDTLREYIQTGGATNLDPFYKIIIDSKFTPEDFDWIFEELGMLARTGELYWRKYDKSQETLDMESYSCHLSEIYRLFRMESDFTDLDVSLAAQKIVESVPPTLLEPYKGMPVKDQAILVARKMLL